MFILNCSETKFVKENLKAGNKQIQYQATETYALHLFFGVFPVWGDASIEGTAKQFYKESNKKNYKKVILFSKEKTVLWYLILPVTILFTPVRTELIGEVEN